MPYNLIDIDKLFVEFPVSILASINTFRNTIAVKYFDSTAGIAFTDTFGISGHLFAGSSSMLQASAVSPYGLQLTQL